MAAREGKIPETIDKNDFFAYSKVECRYFKGLEQEEYFFGMEAERDCIGCEQFFPEKREVHLGAGPGNGVSGHVTRVKRLSERLNRQRMPLEVF